MSARSSAGAHGLMQVMPATAKYVARKIGMADFSPSMMGDPNINILLGTNYLSMVLTDLDSSWTLASAAYNAGPGRPKAGAARCRARSKARSSPRPFRSTKRART